MWNFKYWEIVRLKKNVWSWKGHIFVWQLQAWFFKSLKFQRWKKKVNVYGSCVEKRDDMNVWSNNYTLYRNY